MFSTAVCYFPCAFRAFLRTRQSSLVTFSTDAIIDFFVGCIRMSTQGSTFTRFLTWYFTSYFFRRYVFLRKPVEWACERQFSLSVLARLRSPSASRRCAVFLPLCRSAQLALLDSLSERRVELLRTSGLCMCLLLWVLSMVFCIWCYYLHVTFDLFLPLRCL